MPGEVCAVAATRRDRLGGGGLIWPSRSRSFAP